MLEITDLREKNGSGGEKTHVSISEAAEPERAAALHSHGELQKHLLLIPDLKVREGYWHHARRTPGSGPASIATLAVKGQLTLLWHSRTM